MNGAILVVVIARSPRSGGLGAVPVANVRFLFMSRYIVGKYCTFLCSIYKCSDNVHVKLPY